MIFLLETPFLALFFLFGSCLLTACSSLLLQMGKFKFKELFRSPHPPLFFFYPFIHRLFPKGEWENLYFCLSVSKTILQLAYAAFSFYYALASEHLLGSLPPEEKGPLLLLIGSAVIALLLGVDFLFRIIAAVWKKPLFALISPLASFYLILLFPLVGLLLQSTRGILRKLPLEEESAEQLTDKSKIREMIRESELQQHLDINDQKLISSFLNFKQKVAKEIMVPRVDVFSLEADTSIRAATNLFVSEGYSRIPVFRESLDKIIGVVLYKDLLKVHTDPKLDLEAPLESIVKPVLYAPENKKISQLLQEFRSKQIHMAIIVDEYGGTEGIVTIEDILEELVGEIEDEYDIGEDQQFYPLASGGWVVDAKMNIDDIQEDLGVRIPPSSEYETIGGYIFHCTGTIPSKGWRLLHDDFELEILSSNERSIQKIKIVPRRHTSSC